MSPGSHPAGQTFKAVRSVRRIATLLNGSRVPWRDTTPVVGILQSQSKTHSRLAAHQTRPRFAHSQHSVSSFLHCSSLPATVPRSTGSLSCSAGGRAPLASLALPSFPGPNPFVFPFFCFWSDLLVWSVDSESHRAARATSRAPAWTLTTWSNTEDGVFSKHFSKMHMVSSPVA